MELSAFFKFCIEQEHQSIQKLLADIDDALLQYKIDDNESIGMRLKHITASEYLMAGYLYPKEGEAQPKIEVSVEALKAAFSNSKARHLETIETMKDVDLDQIWKSPRSGSEFSYKWLLYHFLEHFATHRGQVTTAIRQARS